MPEEKIKILEEKNTHLWFEDSPIAVLAQKLALDIDKAEFFASFKLMNLQPDNLRDICFDIICYDSARQVIDTVCDVFYSGFDVARNIEFGYNRRVPVKNQQTRSVEFVLNFLRIHPKNDAHEKKRPTGNHFQRKTDREEEIRVSFIRKILKKKKKLRKN